MEHAETRLELYIVKHEFWKYSKCRYSSTLKGKVRHQPKYGSYSTCCITESMFLLYWEDLVNSTSQKAFTSMHCEKSRQF